MTILVFSWHIYSSAYLLKSYFSSYKAYDLSLKIFVFLFDLTDIFLHFQGERDEHISVAPSLWRSRSSESCRNWFHVGRKHLARIAVTKGKGMYIYLLAVFMLRDNMTSLPSVGPTWQWHMFSYIQFQL